VTPGHTRSETQHSVICLVYSRSLVYSFKSCKSREIPPRMHQNSPLSDQESKNTLYADQTPSMVGTKTPSHLHPHWHSPRPTGLSEKLGFILDDYFKHCCVVIQYVYFRQYSNCCPLSDRAGKLLLKTFFFKLRSPDCRFLGFVCVQFYTDHI